MKTYLVRAFVKDGQGGNPAGVVLDADGLSDVEMQEMAAKINVSETAFVQKSDEADYKVRFFTPTAEVDLCGHATIATFSVLAKELPAGIYRQETKAGILNVEIAADGLVYMDQAKPEFLEVLSSEEVAKVLNIPAEWITNTKLESQIISTGAKDLMIPIDTREHLFEIDPDWSKITEFSEKNNLIGFHVFTLDTVQSNATANARNFAPVVGINEETATGVSTGALACYLFKNGKVEAGKELIFEQGYSMNQPSELYARLDNTNGLQVKIGGRAVVDRELIDIK